MQILPNLYLVNGYPYSQHQNSYLIKLDGALVLVDSGDLEDRETFDLLAQNMGIWGFDITQVTHMLVTHAHFDHASHAARMQRLGAQIIANAPCAEALAAGDDRCIGYAVQRVFEPCQVDQVVGEGDELAIGGAVFRCLMAPGHAESCTIYELELDGRRLWFVGDVVMMGHECRSIEPGWNGGPDYDRPTYLETLRRLCHMPCDVILPGHGPACIGGGQRFFQRVYTYAMMNWR